MVVVDSLYDVLLSVVDNLLGGAPSILSHRPGSKHFIVGELQSFTKDLSVFSFPKHTMNERGRDSQMVSRRLVNAMFHL